MPRFACLLLVALAPGCARIEFSGGGGDGSGGTPPTVGGGGASAGGGSNDGGGGGEPQGGSPDPCPGVPEMCNGIDDDCDGVADEPDTFPANACECDWVSFEGRPYASCPTLGPPEAANCPAGMRIVVLQSMAEHDALLDLVLVEDQDGYVGIRQADGAPERGTDWSWFREGMPPPWFLPGGEPDDYTPGGFEPIPIENDSENCGGLYNYGDLANSRGFVDSDCIDAFERVLCEPIADECIEGAECLLAQGCTGTFDCSLATGSQCVAVATTETCDGIDNNCDGEVDEGVCGCAEITDGMTGRQYRKCSAQVFPEAAHCGPGFRLAMLENLSEVAFAENLLAGSEAVWLGLYQRTNTNGLSEGWQFFDGSILTMPFWNATQPNDSDDLENGQQNCSTLQASGCHDTICNDQFSYLCEEL